MVLTGCAIRRIGRVLGSELVVDLSYLLFGDPSQAFDYGSIEKKCIGIGRRQGRIHTKVYLYLPSLNQEMDDSKDRPLELKLSYLLSSRYQRTSNIHYTSRFNHDSGLEVLGS